MKNLILPCLENFKRELFDREQNTCIKLLESYLKDIASPFIKDLSSHFGNLTPTEIRIASLIKEGETTKEIADLLCLSENTVMAHRYNIRSKLNLKNKKVNLRSYLESLK